MEPGRPLATTYSPAALISRLLALAVERRCLPLRDAPLSLPQLRRLMYAILTEGYGA
jgi:hypothetical protein